MQGPPSSAALALVHVRTPLSNRKRRSHAGMLSPGFKGAASAAASSPSPPHQHEALARHHHYDSTPAATATAGVDSLQLGHPSRDVAANSSWGRPADASQAASPPAQKAAAADDDRSTPVPDRRLYPRRGSQSTSPLLQQPTTIAESPLSPDLMSCHDPADDAWWDDGVETEHEEEEDVATEGEEEDGEFAECLEEEDGQLLEGEFADGGPGFSAPSSLFFSGDEGMVSSGGGSPSGVERDLNFPLPCMFPPEEPHRYELLSKLGEVCACMCGGSGF